MQWFRLFALPAVCAVAAPTGGPRDQELTSALETIHHRLQDENNPKAQAVGELLKNLANMEKYQEHPREPDLTLEEKMLREYVQEHHESKIAQNKYQKDEEVVRLKRQIEVQAQRALDAEEEKVRSRLREMSRMKKVLEEKMNLLGVLKEHHSDDFDDKIQKDAIAAQTREEDLDKMIGNTLRYTTPEQAEQKKIAAAKAAAVKLLEATAQKAAAEQPDQPKDRRLSDPSASDDLGALIAPDTVPGAAIQTQDAQNAQKDTEEAKTAQKDTEEAKALAAETARLAADENKIRAAQTTALKAVTLVENLTKQTSKAAPSQATESMPQWAQNMSKLQTSLAICTAVGLATSVLALAIHFKSTVVRMCSNRRQVIDSSSDDEPFVRK